MKLFSKRTTTTRAEALDDRLVSARLRARRSELISSETRNRIVSEIKFITSNDDFLEKFILSEDQVEDRIYLDKHKLDNFSLAELGYRLSDYFDFEDFDMHSTELRSRYNENEVEKFFDDTRLFDLAEITILFARSEKRTEVIKRFNNILSEENADFQIIEHLITKLSGETLRTLRNILKDNNIKSKLGSYFDFETSHDYVNAAKLSADIVNLIFSGVIKDQKPKEIKALKDRLTQKLLGPQADKEKIERLDKYIDSLLKTAKDLSNDTYDVRHTEKSTLQVKNDNFYKLIAGHNMSIVELVLTTLKDDYVLSDDWENIKSNYVKKYKINTNERITISKADIDDQPIDLSDIPF